MAEHRADKKDGWQRYDWLLIEFDYVCSIEWQGLRKIAKKNGCNLKTVARHSKKDNWYQKRCEHLAHVAREAEIIRYMRMCEDDVLDVINEDRVANGLEPLEKLTSKWKKILREEVEKLY